MNNYLDPELLDEDIADAAPPDLEAPRRKLVDPRTLPARFHHLRAAGQSGAHCLHAFQVDSDDSLAKRLGSGVHALLFDKPVAVWDVPAKNGRGTAKRDPRSAVWQAFQKKHAGMPILTVAEHAHAQRIRDAVRGHAIAERLLFGPEMVHERSIIWSELGRARQSTPDARGPSHLVELKTTRCAAPWAFARDVKKYAYHAQLADQRAAIAHERNGRAPREVFIVAVETVPPYVVQPYELTATTLEDGDKLRLLWLERLQLFEATNLWGGYAPSTLQLELPDNSPPPVADPSWASGAGDNPDTDDEEA